jgi:pyridoxamine 5'-phosphate oxidase
MEPRSTHARKEYEQGALDEATVARDPIRQFAVWYDGAVAAGVPEPEAMTLATATPDGRPSARIVLLAGRHVVVGVVSCAVNVNRARTLGADGCVA